MMPIYEYQCNACGHQFESFQRISEDPLTDCPKCQKAELKKLVSAAGFRLSGSGWYETDFKTGKKPEKPEKKDASTADKAKPDKTETKSTTTKKEEKKTDD